MSRYTFAFWRAVSVNVRAFCYWTDRRNCPRVGDAAWRVLVTARRAFGVQA